MNLGKVKTFLIILFLGINIYLSASHFFATRFFVDNKTVEQTLEILKSHDITIDKATIPRYTVNLKNIDTSNIVYNKKFKSKTKDGVFSVSGDDFSCEIDIHGKSTSDKAIKNQIKEFLKDAGFSVKYMDFGKVKKTNDNKGKTFSINCKVDGYRIFDSKIDVCVADGTIQLNGRWFEPTESDVVSASRSRQSVYITSILVSLIQNEDVVSNAPVSIKKIDCGYLSGSLYAGGGHIETTARPYYKLTDKHGNTYYYDAKDGSYLKN